ncbi:hypothetical protein SpCBS45565_g07989 [Spizellomyces sp. 'palustris']|nr:hypothetical protein SpCBS45565_g07989 [Spizellomyces sp. 'palustris']
MALSNSFVLTHHRNMAIFTRTSIGKDPQHPYGFTAERYAWALVSGVGVFFLGGGVSIYHGISGLMAAHHALGDVTSSWIVLGASLLFEGGTMTYAWRHISKSAEAAGVSVLEYLRRGADPTAVQVFMEDCAAVAGVVVAGSCLTLSKLLNLPVIDSIGSITIGILLSCVATFLIRRNIAGLVETSMPAHRQAEIVRELESDPVVSSVQDVKSTALGPEWARFKAEILFNGEEVTRRYITRNPELFAMEYEQLKKLKTREEVEVWLQRQGGRVVSTLGSEVDRLEFNIMTKRPEVKHIDLEIEIASMLKVIQWYDYHRKPKDPSPSTRPATRKLRSEFNHLWQFVHIFV